jgi:hypothetical protein
LEPAKRANLRLSGDGKWMRESAVEKYLVSEVEKCGGLCPKFSSPSNRGVPDRLMLLPGGLIVFVEVKAPGKRPTELQRFWLERLELLGFSTAVVDSRETVREAVQRFSTQAMTMALTREEGEGAPR